MVNGAKRLRKYLLGEKETLDLKSAAQKSLKKTAQRAERSRLTGQKALRKLIDFEEFSDHVTEVGWVKECS